LVKSNIYSCTRINDSLFAFGTFVNGLVVIDKNGKIFQIINDKKGLPTNYILRMYVDNFQNLWLLLSEGMVQVDILSPLLHFDESDGLLGTVDNVVYHDSCYYISTMKNFFRLQSQNTENISRPALTKLNEKNSYYWTQTEINGILFTIQFEQIAYLKDDKIIPIPDTKSQYLLAKTAKFPNYLFFSLNNKICASEISVDRKKNVKLGQLLKFPEFTAIVREMKTDRDGNFWFFDNYANLYCIKFTDNQDITKYKYLKADTSEYYQKDFLKDISVINDTIVIYGKNQLLTPTVTNDDKIKFVPFHNFPTDKNSKLKNLYLTKNGADYFCITDSGVCISTKKNKFRFDFNPFIAISNPKNIINTDKYFWILTSDNILYQYDKFRTAEYDRPFKVLIRKVYSNTDSLIFNGEYIDNNSKIGKFFTKTIAEQPENSIPVFKYRHNSISFSYSAVFFEHSESTLYQYKLEGFDENWSNFSKAVLKEYTNLPPGKYCFKIRAKNIYNTMSSKTEYRFVILKPWYRTIVAYVSYFVILFLLIYLIVYLNGRRLKSANIKLERIVRERTHEIFQQKEEISAQADELQTQAEQLQLINIELEKLSIAASETDNAIIIMDADTNFEWVNLGFTKLLGFTFDELLQNFGKRLLDSSSNSNIADVIETSRKTMNSVIYDSKIKTKDGSEIWTQTTITPIIKNNKIVKFIAIDSDIRKLKDAEHIIKLKNEQITSSIRYAKTIQSAILPIKEQIDRYFENFIIYRPKDIVSGDFYWYNRIGDYHFVGVIDCTGHGVPGAFMSMIGNTLLNEIIISQKIYEPDMILNSLDDRSRKSLHQDLSESRDGMDLCLCRIEKTENKFQLKYAGAKCPLLYFNSVKNELETLKANRISIGGLKKNLPQTFTAQTIELSSGDFIIMSSDGFSDQNNRQRERFGTLQVIDILVKNKEKNISEIGAIMEKSLNNWMDGTNQRDDITMIGVAF
jgi:PAS domain S-box-containing protein